jgi:hypothetical protein
MEWNGCLLIIWTNGGIEKIEKIGVYGMGNTYIGWTAALYTLSKYLISAK